MQPNQITGRHFYPTSPAPNATSTSSSLTPHGTGTGARPSDLSAAQGAAALRGASLAFSAYPSKGNYAGQTADHAGTAVPGQQQSQQQRPPLLPARDARSNGALVAATQAARDRSLPRSPLWNNNNNSGNGGGYGMGVTAGDNGGSAASRMIGRQSTGGSVQDEDAASGRPVAQRASLYMNNGSAGGGAGQNHLAPPVRPNVGVGKGQGAGTGLADAARSTSFIAATLAASRSASPSPHHTGSGAGGTSPGFAQRSGGGVRRPPSFSVEGSDDAHPPQQQQYRGRRSVEVLDTTSIAPTTSLISMFETSIGETTRPEQDNAAALRRSLTTKPKLPAPSPQRTRSPEPKSADPRRALSVAAAKRPPTDHGVRAATGGAAFGDAANARPPTPPKPRGGEPRLGSSAAPPVREGNDAAAAADRPQTRDSTSSDDTFVSASSVQSAQSAAPQPSPQPPPQPRVARTASRRGREPASAWSLLGDEDDGPFDHPTGGRKPRAPTPLGTRAPAPAHGHQRSLSTHSALPPHPRRRASASPLRPQLSGAGRRGTTAAFSASSGNLPLEGLTDAIMAGSLAAAAAARDVAAASAAASTPPPPPPPPRRRHERGGSFHHALVHLPHHALHLPGSSPASHHSSRDVSPRRIGQQQNNTGGGNGGGGTMTFPTTLRPQQPKSKGKKGKGGSEDSDEDRPRRRNKSGKTGLGGTKHAHHEGARRRWRDAVTERERRRYEAVWASNRGLWLAAGGAEPTTTGHLYHHHLVLPSRAQTTFTPPPATTAPDSSAAAPSPDSELHPSQRVANVVVRDLWARSRLPADELAEVWDLVDRSGGGSLSRREFVVGLWLVDQRLRGRKIPVRVSDSVWASAAPGGGAGRVVVVPGKKR